MAPTTPNSRTPQRRRAPAKPVGGKPEGVIKRSKTSSKAAPKNKKSPTFPFMRLPGELRNAIYTCCLTTPGELILEDRIKAARRVVTLANSGASLIPSILGVSKQIHAESAPMLYASNNIVLNNTQAMYTFLMQCGSHKTFITDLKIRGWGMTGSHKAMNHPAFGSLIGTTNLRKLHIDCSISWHGEPKKLASRFYRDAHYWLEDMARKMDKKDLVRMVEWVEQEETESQMNLGWRASRRGHGNGRLSEEKDLDAFRDELVKLLK
ncbi:hypothetical protein M501DRAFT_995507 [Patellaria atrata CBS 101060]|uniref:Uncharacterized protein n=1 Tax=Patellaria atrata CBS 101060 TaxID=1346257 RepID=A0A9P4S7K0_9PEZI|nr:hypothetical protein M501DRAFT_995507 [Patellaria atrata CBS 101060]